MFMNAFNQQIFNNASDDKYEIFQNTLLRIVVCVKRRLLRNRKRKFKTDGVKYKVFEEEELFQQIFQISMKCKNCSSCC